MLKRFLVLMLTMSMVWSLAAPVSAAATTTGVTQTQVKAIEEDCLVIFIDGQNLGEQVAKDKWQWMVNAYAAGGEHLNVAATDWYYYASPPFGLGNPLETGKTTMQTAEWLQAFLKKVGKNDFPWERVFLHVSDSRAVYRLEPQDFGFDAGYMTSLPDNGAFAPYGNPFNKNFILLGFPDNAGIHGEVHVMEGIMNQFLGGVVWKGDAATRVAEGKVVFMKFPEGVYYADKSYIEFIQSTGVCHTVPKSYLDSVGIVPDSQWLRSKHPVTEDSHGAEMFAGPYYHYFALGTGTAENTYDAYLMKTWRAKYWQILEYYRRFFEYSPTATTPSFPTTAPVVAVKPTAAPSPWATASVNKARLLNLSTAEMTENYQEVTTRAQFARAAVNFLRQYGYDVDSTKPKIFADTDDYDIGLASALGITAGTDTTRNLFSPDSLLTREQAAGLLHNTLKVVRAECGTASVQWTDADDISVWAKTAVDVVCNSSIMNGTSSTALTFSPKSNYTHEQSVVTLMRMWDFLRPG